MLLMECLNELNHRDYSLSLRPFELFSDCHVRFCSFSGRVSVEVPYDALSLFYRDLDNRVC